MLSRSRSVAVVFGLTLALGCGSDSPTGAPAGPTNRERNHPPRLLVSSARQIATSPSPTYEFWIQAFEDEDATTGIRELTLMGGDVTVTGTNDFRYLQTLPHMSGGRGLDTVRVSGLQAGGTYTAFARVWDGYDTTTGSTQWTVPGAK